MDFKFPLNHLSLLSGPLADFCPQGPQVLPHHLRRGQFDGAAPGGGVGAGLRGRLPLAKR